jgi:uncharacterized repeat protein (TIGR01451 family)
VHISGTLNDNGTGTVQIQYNACRTGDITVNGSGSLRIDAFDLGLGAPTDFTITFVRLTLSGSVAGEVSGTLRERLDLAARSITTTENLVVRSGATMTKSENLTFVDVLTTTGFVETVNGRVFHSVHGFVDISTTVPLVFATLTQDFPNNGMLLLTGANGAAVRVTALSPTQLNLAVDADGNGVFETAVLLTWSDLSGPVGADLGDDDRDGMHNGWEIAHNLNPKDPSDALADADGDGATNLAEYQAGTNPRSAASVPPAVGLSIQASDAPDPVVVGALLTYTLSVSNSTSLSANNVALIDTLPATVSLVSASTTQGTCAGVATVTCTIGTVNNSSIVTVTIVVLPAVAGTITNTATVSTSSFEQLTFDNTATTVTVVTAPSQPPADLQVRIDAAAPGSTITVEPGFYSGPLDFKGKDIVLRSRDGPATTIINGNPGATSTNVPVIAMGPGGTLIGFTISGGNASFGAGVGLSGTRGTVISGNIFEGNSQGGGGFGAAIGGNASSATIERNIFRNNVCDTQFLSGVVAFVNDSSPRIVNNLFVNNNCRAVNLTLPVGNTPEVINNTIVGNRTGIKVDCIVPQVTQIYRNNVIVANDVGFETTCVPAQSPVWTNNLVFGNGIPTVPADYQGIGNLTGTNGNISANPLFVNQAGGNYDLQAGSPAINVGSLLNAPTVDFDSLTRQGGIDIGAFEGP